LCTLLCTGGIWVFILAPFSRFCLHCFMEFFGSGDMTLRLRPSGFLGRSCQRERTWQQLWPACDPQVCGSGLFFRAALVWLVRLTLAPRGAGKRGERSLERLPDQGHFLPLGHFDQLPFFWSARAVLDSPVPLIEAGGTSMAGRDMSGLAPA
jgi:hypothetical protein